MGVIATPAFGGLAMTTPQIKSDIAVGYAEKKLLF